MHWPEPVLAAETAPDGPVMVQVTYRVEPTNRDAFQALMPALADSRHQGGGYRWGLMNDAADPDRFVETWWEASWLDHQRHHVRVTEDSRMLQVQIAALQKDAAEPVVQHFVLPTSTQAGDRHDER